jgi:hypothetical protein
MLPAAYDFALELSEYAEHLEQGTARRRGRVDGLLMQVKVTPHRPSHGGR